MKLGGAGSRTAAGLRRLGAVAVLLPLLCPLPLQAQFGRNKLQHRVFDFQVIRTAHFDVYYYPGERTAALDAARMAERAYLRLSRVLGHEFEERKPLILYASHSEFQQTNALPGMISEGTGGVTEFAKRRVILPFTGSYAEFEHVLTHELVHAFQFDLVARGLVNRLDPVSFRPPLWFMEGMAEYLAVGGVDPLTRAWLRDALSTGYLRTIPQLSATSDYLSYRFGQSVWSFIGAKFGDETVGLILKRATRIGVDGGIEMTLGISIDRLSEEWVQSIRMEHLPAVARAGHAREFGRQLTDHDFRSDAGHSYLAPALSPDGTRVVYLSDRGNRLYSFFDLWLASAETGQVVDRLIEAARTPDFESLRFMTSSAAWSPDGRQIAFVAKVGGRDALYLYDVRHRRVARRIGVPVDGIQNPTYSPDGLHLAFTGIQGGVSDLYVVDVDGRHFRQLTDDRFADLHPAWSPDGAFIAISTDRGGATDFDELVFGQRRIGLYRIGTGDVVMLPRQDEGNHYNPVWSPDGDAIAFVSDRGGTANLYLYSRSEDQLYQLTDVLTGVGGMLPSGPSISWSADRDRLAFTYFEGAGYNIYTVDEPLRAAWPVEERVTAPVAARAARASRSGAASESAGAEDSELPSLRLESFYRTAQGFRPSAAKPATDEAFRAELTIRDLLDDPGSGLPDTLDFTYEHYRPKLTPDVIGRPVIGAQVGGHFGNGVFGGSYIVLSDLLGNHNVLLWAQLAGSLQDAYLLAEYAYLRERANVSMSYQQFPLYRFRGTTVRDEVSSVLVEERFLRDIYRTLSTEIQYPFSPFQRLELTLTGIHVGRDSIVERFRVAPGLTRGDRTTERLENLIMAGPSLALVWDNALFGYTGPIAGRRYRLGLGRLFGDVEINDLHVDFRNYVNLGGQFSLAVRALGLWRSGAGAGQFQLYWGGPYFLRGYDGGSFTREECIASAGRVRGTFTTGCPVRDQLIGSSIALLNTEFRFPIVGFTDLGFVPLGLPPVQGVVFFDAGAAFNAVEELVWSRSAGLDPFRVREPVASYGIGLRVRALYTVVRIDYSVPLDRPDHGAGLWSLSFGPTF